MPMWLKLQLLGRKYAHNIVFFFKEKRQLFRRKSTIIAEISYRNIDPRSGIDDALKATSKVTLIKEFNTETSRLNDNVCFLILLPNTFVPK
jgi:hypothetical protein